MVDRRDIFRNPYTEDEEETNTLMSQLFPKPAESLYRFEATAREEASKDRAHVESLGLADLDSDIQVATEHQSLVEEYIDRRKRELIADDGTAKRVDDVTDPRL